MPENQQIREKMRLEREALRPAALSNSESEGEIPGKAWLNSDEPSHSATIESKNGWKEAKRCSKLSRGRKERLKNIAEH
jgi:hypothetical protein